MLFHITSQALEKLEICCLLAVGSEASTPPGKRGVGQI